MLIKIVFREIVSDAFGNNHRFVYSIFTDLFAIIERILECYVMVYTPGLNTVFDHSGYHFITRVNAWRFVTEKQHECQKR